MNENAKTFWKKSFNIMGIILLMFICCSTGFIGGCIAEYCYATKGIYTDYQSSLSELESKQRAIKGELEFQGRLNQAIKQQLEFERKTNKKIDLITASEIIITKQERQAQQQSKKLLEQIGEIQAADIDIYERNARLIGLIESAIAGD